MLARTTRVLFFTWFGVLAAALFRGVTSGWSIGVALVLVALFLGHPALLALEFALSRRVGRRTNGERVSFGAVARAWLGEWIESTCTFGWRLPWREHAIPDHLPPEARGRRGVVLVHGFICNRGFWNPWLARLRAQERPFVAVTLAPVFAGIDGYAPALEEAIARVEAATGRPPVVVAHSMGGLVVRAWARAGAGRQERLEHVITIGTPHRGTWLAGLALSPNARQMRSDAAWMAALAAEPIDPARFSCWWSDCDQIVFPSPTAELPGAVAHRVSGVAHVALARREEIWLALLERLDAPG